MVICPKCGYENSDDALICNLCKEVLRKVEENKQENINSTPLLQTNDKTIQKFLKIKRYVFITFGIIFLLMSVPIIRICTKVIKQSYGFIIAGNIALIWMIIICLYIYFCYKYW
jgi:uncharacterized membrane protein YvbJ